MEPEGSQTARGGGDLLRGDGRRRRKRGRIGEGPEAEAAEAEESVRVVTDPPSAGFVNHRPGRRRVCGEATEAEKDEAEEEEGDEEEEEDEEDEEDEEQGDVVGLLEEEDGVEYHIDKETGAMVSHEEHVRLQEGRRGTFLVNDITGEIKRLERRGLARQANHNHDLLHDSMCACVYACICMYLYTPRTLGAHSRNERPPCVARGETLSGTDRHTIVAILWRKGRSHFGAGGEKGKGENFHLSTSHRLPPPLPFHLAG